MKDCLTPEILSRYHAGLLEDDDLFDVEEHLFTCDDCDGLSQRIAEIMQEELEQKLVPEVRPLAFLAQVPLAALSKARIDRWIEAGADIAARVVIASRNVSYDFAGLSDLMRAETLFSPSLATTGVSRGPEEEQAPLTGPRLELPSSGKLRARLMVDAHKGSLTVQVDSVPAHLPPPLVAVRLAGGETLIRETTPHTPRFGNPDTRDCVAKFAIAANQDLLVLVEPVDEE